MEGIRPARALVSAGRGRLASFGRRLLNHSLVLYLVAVAADRAWLLLNTDVVQLVRRVH